jgi:phosphatidylglycerophosphatase A
MSEQTEAKPAKKPRVALWIATGFGLGYLPVAPGTWGSLGGVFIAWFFTRFQWQNYDYLGIGVLFPPQHPRADSGGAANVLGTFAESIFTWFVGYALIVIVTGLMGVWASRKAAIHFRNPDPGQVVIDEISGQQIAYLPLIFTTFGPLSWKLWVVGFMLFRIFDIVKPWPASAAEKWPGRRRRASTASCALIRTAR